MGRKGFCPLLLHFPSKSALQEKSGNRPLLAVNSSALNLSKNSGVSLALVAPYRVILQYYRRDTPYRE